LIAARGLLGSVHVDYFQALVLGLVEGLTEYLPVSSTGHLLLAQRLMGIESSTAADAFAISIQGGAILAVLGLYRARVAQMTMGLLGQDQTGRRLLLNLVSAFVPAAVLGLLLEKPIKKYLFGGDEWGLWPVVAAWFVGGLAILAVSVARRRRGASPSTGLDLDQLTIRMALIVGFAQCLAMWPGVSRSLITIVGGVLVGLSLPAAVELSFLLGVITLTAATMYDALKHGPEMLATYGAVPLLIGFVSAWISAVLAVKWMVNYLKSHGMEIFGWYRVALAIAVTIWLLWPAGATATAPAP
jgi:undecaprenyl-diphosphatase